MKKILFTLLTFSSLFFASCSSDNDDNSTGNFPGNSSENILGKWALYKETHNGDDIYPDYTLDENDLIETLDFVNDYGADEDGFYTGTWWDYHNYTDVFDWKSIGNNKFQLKDAYFLYLDTGGIGVVEMFSLNQLKLEYSNDETTIIQYYQKIEDY